MRHQHPYLIVAATGPGRAVRGHRRAGRHRLSTGVDRPRLRGWSTHRARHRRRTAPMRGVAVRYGGLLAVLGTVAVSGWFAATGAAAFAQMTQP